MYGEVTRDAINTIWDLQDLRRTCMLDFPFTKLQRVNHLMLDLPSILPYFTTLSAYRIVLLFSPTIPRLLQTLVTSTWSCKFYLSIYPFSYFVYSPTASFARLVESSCFMCCFRLSNSVVTCSLSCWLGVFNCSFFCMSSCTCRYTEWLAVSRQY